MFTGREDYEGALKSSAIPIGEPVLIFRAQDVLAADTGRYWAMRFLQAGGSTAVAEQLLRQVDRIDAWTLKKLPAADKIADPAPLQAAFALRGFVVEPGADRTFLDLERTKSWSDGYQAGVRSERQAMARLQARVSLLERELAAGRPGAAESAHGTATA